jgi:hypothetical protein
MAGCPGREGARARATGFTGKPPRDRRGRRPVGEVFHGTAGEDGMGTRAAVAGRFRGAPSLGFALDLEGVQGHFLHCLGDLSRDPTPLPAAHPGAEAGGEGGHPRRRRSRVGCRRTPRRRPRVKEADRGFLDRRRRAVAACADHRTGGRRIPCPSGGHDHRGRTPPRGRAARRCPGDGGRHGPPWPPPPDRLHGTDRAAGRRRPRAIRRGPGGDLPAGGPGAGDGHRRDRAGEKPRGAHLHQQHARVQHRRPPFLPL